jgi:hypothetical protein
MITILSSCEFIKYLDRYMHHRTVDVMLMNTGMLHTSFASGNSKFRLKHKNLKVAVICRVLCNVSSRRLDNLHTLEIDRLLFILIRRRLQRQLQARYLLLYTDNAVSFSFQ